MAARRPTVPASTRDGVTEPTPAEATVAAREPEGATDPPSVDLTELHSEAEASDGPPIGMIGGLAVWCGEDVKYRYNPETRELEGANVRVWWGDGERDAAYEARIRRDGGSTWAWHDDRVGYRGNHQPDIGTVVTRALSTGRAAVGAPT